MKILVTQTTRMGDVLQTSPLIRQIRQQYPKAHITVMVRRMGKVIADHHPDVDEVIVYNEDEIFSYMKAQDSEKLLKAYELAEGRIRALKEAQYDLVYNVTHSIGSAMMLKLAGVPKVMGADLSDDWQFLLRGNWANYFFTSVFSRDYNDLNLCDISRSFASEAPPCRELVFEVEAAADTWVDSLFQEHHITPRNFVVCMQLGASENNKRWHEERFAALAKMMVERLNAHIFLVGVKEEAAYGDIFLKHAPGSAIPLYGKTNIPQLAALLKRSRVLITNDTGTMHIAAAVDCPITLVSVGHVHYRETGPYGAGHCAIEWRRSTLGRSDYVPGGEEERSQILPEQVYRAMELSLQHAKGAPQQWDETLEMKNVDLYVTRFAPDGFLKFLPVIKRPMQERDFMRMAYRAMWLHHLNERYDKKGETESMVLSIGHYTGPEKPVVSAWCEEISHSFEELMHLSQRGVQITETLLEILRKGKGMLQAKELVSQLMAIDEEARVFSEIHAHARPLILIARFERDNLEGADPLVLAKTTLDIYRSCYARSRMLCKKLQRIVALWP